MLRFLLKNTHTHKEKIGSRWSCLGIWGYGDEIVRDMHRFLQTAGGGVRGKESFLCTRKCGGRGFRPRGLIISHPRLSLISLRR